MLQTILLALVAGIIIGPLARMVLPGRQNISLVMTVVLGAIGALAGSAIYSAASGRTDTSGIDWIALAIGVVVAAIAITVYAMMTGRRRSGSSGHPVT
jgi:uncharacterized membrane protein YeaQ/YmgE (transglycosylase-associated protein family)